MAKDKERSINPAAQQRKLDKAKALKKGKAEVQARKTEKLARRNPERLQRQIDELKALEESHQIKPREKQILEELERDLRAVKKAREALGDKAPKFGREPRQSTHRDDSGVLGKRRWDGERKENSKRFQDEPSSGSETDESVRRIPMPKDTPPPIPRRFHPRNHDDHFHDRNGTDERLPPHSLPQKPPTSTYEPKTTYESAPQIRDLRKEAVSRFVPSVVRRKQEAVKGHGGLVEPEELDRLESQGYGDGGGSGGGNQQTAMSEKPTAPSGGTDAEAEEEARRLAEEEARRLAEEEARRLAEEEARFQDELKHVQIEEVEDEDL